MTISLISILAVVFIIIALGVGAYFIGSAPGIDADFKGLIKWILYGIAIIVALVFVWSLITGNGTGIVIGR